MKKVSFALVGAAALALSACGGQGDDTLGDNVADNYDAAADNLDAMADKRYKRLEVRIEPDGELWRLSVLDSGGGIAEADLAKVFDPFFTTKPVGQGTGLGLSTIYGFARQSGGHVLLSSVVGQGTEVTLLLPASAEAALAGATVMFELMCVMAAQVDRSR